MNLDQGTVEGIGIVTNNTSRIDTLLRPGRFKENFQDPNYLPHISDIEKAFSGLHGRNEPRPLTTFCRDHNIYELPTKEFVDALGTYLQQRIKLLLNAGRGQIDILEVAAGDGKLSHHLQNKLKELGIAQAVSFHTTDDRSWEKTHEVNPAFPVENLPYDKAVQKYHPDIVICSWMPAGKDWTPVFRKHASIAEYILIGEEASSYDSSVGTPSAWGKDIWDKNNQSKISEMEKDGFTRISLDRDRDLGFKWPRQISTVDNAIIPGEGIGMSSTVSFRRIDGPLGAVHKISF